VKLGTENKKQVIALGALAAVALVLLSRTFWPSTPDTSQAMAPTPGNTAIPLTRRTASGKVVKITEPRLDPTLELDVLQRSEQAKYEGSGRNIFVNGPAPIPVPKRNGTTDQQQMIAQQRAAQVYVPPPITLKFFGFANRPGEPKRVFLVQGDDVFIAGEGDIVNRRYRVLRISTASVDIEDVLTNNRQSIPLTQG
jgi:hypothetical protein